MNNDVKLILKRTVLTYTYILFTVFILKLCGLDYFGIDISNPFILWLDGFLNNFIVFNVINFILIMVYQHIMLSLMVDNKCYKFTAYSAFFTFAFQFGLKKRLMVYNLGTIGELLYLFILHLCYIKSDRTSKSNIKRFIFVILINMFYQLLSYATRYAYSLDYIVSPSINFIMNIDYLILMVMTYKLYFMKGDVKLCGVFQAVVGSSSQKLTLLKEQQKQFQTNYSKTSKKEKFELIIYLILLFLWNMFTLFCIFLVAKLNGTIVECLFIISSFWLNKKSFGKPFHLKNAFHCFLVSNITYYCLNRVTAPLDISMLIPIVLGILLAWFTSKLVKANKKPLYRGMSEEELNSKLDRIGAEPIDYKICKHYYVDGYSEVKVATLTFYSVENIKKRKRNINDKLKGLII